jgi:hypothetical protein
VPRTCSRSERGAARLAPGAARPEGPAAPGTKRTAARGKPRATMRDPAITVADSRRNRSQSPDPSRRRRYTGTVSHSEERETACSRRDAASKLGKLDFRASLPSRIRTLVPTVRRHQGRCSLGLPPLQGFLPQCRGPAFTGPPFTGFATCPTRGPCASLPLKGHQRWGWLVSFETAAPLEVSHLVA